MAPPRFSTASATNPLAIGQTDYTAQYEIVQEQVGFNINHTWQIQYTAKFQEHRCTARDPGEGSPSIQTRFR